MARFLKSRAKAHGTMPGSLIFIGNQKTEIPEIYFIMLGGMMVLAAVMLYFFKKKGWL